MARWRYRLRLVRPRDELSQAEARRCGLLQGEPTTQASAQPTRNSGQSRSFATSWRLEPTIAIGRSNEFKCKLQACIITISSITAITNTKFKREAATSPPLVQHIINIISRVYISNHHFSHDHLFTFNLQHIYSVPHRHRHRQQLAKTNRVRHTNTQTSSFDQV